MHQIITQACDTLAGEIQNTFQALEFAIDRSSFYGLVGLAFRWLLPAFIGVSLTMACIKICALFTIRKQHWMTRDVAVVGGSVQRTGDDK